MYTTSNNIDIITIPFRFVNTFLINYKSSYILVDTGYPKDYLKLYNKISLITLDSDLSNLKYIIITHHHSDHTGAIWYLKKINPKIQIIAHKNCFDNLEKGSNRIDEKYFTCSKTLQRLTRLSHKLLKNSGKFTPYKKQENDFVVDDKPLYLDLESFDIFYKDLYEKKQDKDKNPPYLKIFYTPGHTNDSVSIKINSFIIVGDTMASSFNVFGNRFLPVIFSNLSTLYKSWENILEENVKTILPSHGNSFDQNNVSQNLRVINKIYKI